MAVPNSRATLISYCKRKLGDGVIDINVSSPILGDERSYLAENSVLASASRN